MNISSFIKLLFPLLVVQVMLSPVSGQKDIKQVRQGNRNYKDRNFTEAEMSYRRSIDENPEYNKAIFNLGDALYKQEKYEDAIKSFSSIADRELDVENKSRTLYNIGNTLLKSNKLQESIESYKSSLRSNPDMQQAKYNLAYAQDLLKQQEEQDKKDQENKDKNKDQKQDKKDQDQQNKDQDKSDEQSDDQKDDQKDQPEEDKQDNNDQQKQKEQQQPQISKEDAERLLQALAADEQSVQEKVKKAKAAKSRIRTLKNW